jgi:hypothetical protein
MPPTWVDFCWVLVLEKCDDVKQIFVIVRSSFTNRMNESAICISCFCLSQTLIKTHEQPLSTLLVLESTPDVSTTLRSLVSIFLLATAALAQEPDGVHRGYEHTATSMREGHDDGHCDAVDVFVEAQMQVSASSSTGGLNNHPLCRSGALNRKLNRKLRTGAPPRELGWCDEDCRCQKVEMCYMGGHCADSCPNCGCGRRAQDGVTTGERDFEQLKAVIFAEVGPALMQLAINFQAA